MELSERQAKLVADNHNLIYGFAHRRKLDIDEWYGKLAIELCEAVKNWDETRSRLSTYYYMRADTLLVRDYQRRQYLVRSANEDVMELKLDILEDEDDTEEIVLESILECGDYDMIMLRYYGYTQEEIAEILGTHQSTVSIELNNALEKYKEGLR